jgi:hypothetical protein
MSWGPTVAGAVVGAVASALLWACAGVPEADAGAGAGEAASQQRAWAHCPMPAPSAAPALTVLDRETAWQAALNSTGAPAVPSPFDGAIDWRHERVLIVSAGTVPSGGHSVALAARGLRVEAGVLHVHARLARPSADAMVTQALATPCLLLRVSGSGWSRAELSWE